jgi:GH15 family glucan-1,4-alpha-glucosidase
VIGLPLLRLTDFMVPHQKAPHLVRILECLEGRVPVHVDFSPRLAFGRAIPRVTTSGDVTLAMAGADALYVRGGPAKVAPKPVDDFIVTPGKRISYVMTWGPSFQPAPDGVDAVQGERETERFWTKWASQIQAPPRYRDTIVRSLITLKACTYEPTCGLVAAPTTSLPETPGGVRNWDYRFTWLRDSVLALRGLMNAGLPDEAIAFREWMLRAVAGDPSQIQIRYGLRGERRLSESELPWLPGYEGAKPVRVGNGAYDQFQLDVFGEVATALRFAHRKFGMKTEVGAQLLFDIASFVADHWREPDRGIWEMRGPERSFTASKVSAWAALDAAIDVIESGGRKYPTEKLRNTRQTIFEEVCEKDFNAEKNTFTQYYGGTDLDASLLFIPLLGFLPATDPRVVGTVAALERELMPGGLLLRFKPVGEVDGLSGDEGGIPRLLVLAGGYLLPDGSPGGRGEAVRAALEPHQRRGPFGRGVRPLPQEAPRKLSSGIHPLRSGERRIPDPGRGSGLCTRADRALRKRESRATSRIIATREERQASRRRRR